jgi:predicted nucleic acid-binding protein
MIQPGPTGRPNARALLGSGPVLINAEISAHVGSEAELESIVDDLEVTMVRIPKPALFMAGKAYLTYRRAGGIRTGVLPDFFIGANAQVLACRSSRATRGAIAPTFPMGR